LPPVTVSGTWVAAAADNGKLLAFPLDEMKTLTGGKGVQIMKLEDHEHLSAVTTFDGERLLLEGKTRTGKPVSLTLSGAALIRYLLHRARKGHDMEKISVVTRLAIE